MSELVRIVYKDHILFRNTDPSRYEPCVRETVGWLIKETDEAIWILWDRSVKPLPHERPRPEESGLVILKSEILEMRKIG